MTDRRGQKHGHSEIMERAGSEFMQMIIHLLASVGYMRALAAIGE
jgi:hypothetical protein